MLASSWLTKAALPSGRPVRSAACLKTLRAYDTLVVWSTGLHPATIQGYTSIRGSPSQLPNRMKRRRGTIYMRTAAEGTTIYRIMAEYHEFCDRFLGQHIMQFKEIPDGLSSLD